MTALRYLSACRTTQSNYRTSASTILIHPNQIASSDLAAQARLAALQAGQGLQAGAKGAADSISKFVEGQDDGAAGSARRKAEPERKDFWDSFGAPDNTESSKPSSIGTSAMKGGGGGGVGRPKDDGWDYW